MSTDYKVINIKSEILFREAEDDLFFFNKPSVALKKLKNALLLTPSHIKSLICAGDICFFKGYTKKALDYYLKAEKILPNNAKIQASIANCHKTSGNMQKALLYADRALENIDKENVLLYIQLLEMKTEIFLSQNKYSQARRVFQNLRDIANRKLDFEISNFNFKFLSDKIELGKKLADSNLKVV